MDPNATLDELRECVRTEDYEGRMIELFEALDNWLTKGGGLPKDWLLSEAL